MAESVQPEWCASLAMREQTVLFLAARGADGVAKYHPTKAVQRAYRATVLRGGCIGRSLGWGENGDSFMTLDVFADDAAWGVAVSHFFQHVDELPHHFYMHLLH